MDLGLKDKVAIVTGASKGLGLATAKILVEEGAKVTIASRSKDNLNAAIKALGDDNCIAVPCDVTKPEDCDNLIAETISAYKKLDVLITNCGGPPPGDFESVNLDQWDDAVEGSFKSHVYLVNSALPYLKKMKNASILTVTSFTTKQPLNNLILSNAIRSATIGLTKSLSLELGKYGIRVNSILPGWTLTQRVNNLLSNRAEKNNSSFEAELSKIVADIPIGQIGSPEDFGRVAAFLVSPAASYVNGVMLNVDGGIHKGIF